MCLRHALSMVTLVWKVSQILSKLMGQSLFWYDKAKDLKVRYLVMRLKYKVTGMIPCYQVGFMI